MSSGSPDDGTLRVERFQLLKAAKLALEWGKTVKAAVYSRITSVLDAVGVDRRAAEGLHRVEVSAELEQR